MALKLINGTKLDNDLTEIADLIRSKTGGESLLQFPNGFITELAKAYTLKDWSLNDFGTIVNIPTATTIGAFAFNETGKDETLPKLTEIHAPNVTSFFSNLPAQSGAMVFQDCTALTVVDLPNLTSMNSGGYQFAGCTALQHIVLPKAMIGQHCFDGCTSLQTVRIDAHGTTNNYGFANCSNLTGIDFTGAMTGTGTYEFQNCTNLTTIIIRTKAATVTLNNINCFSNTPFASGKAGGTLYVPQEKIVDYQAATNWSTILSYTVTPEEGDPYSQNQILPIEGSIYETQYYDGETIEEEGV